MSLYAKTVGEAGLLEELKRLRVEVAALKVERDLLRAEVEKLSLDHELKEVQDRLARATETLRDTIAEVKQKIGKVRD